MAHQRPDPSEPISASLVLQAAIRWARAQGIRVRADGNDGVTWTDGERWEACPVLGYHGVSPIGAAILQHQPKIPSVRSAAMLVLGVSEIELSGIEYGLTALDEPVVAIREARAGKRQFLHGFEVAVLLRLSLIGTKGDA